MCVSYEKYNTEDLTKELIHHNGVEVEQKVYIDREDGEDYELIAGKWSQKQIENTENGIVVGYSEVDDTLEPISIDFNAHNIVITGSAGSGKTTTILNILSQVARNGYGFCYFSGLETDGMEILSRLPEERLSDVRFVTANSQAELDFELVAQYVTNGRIILFNLESNEGILNDVPVLSDIVKCVIEGQKQSDSQYYICLDHINLSEKEFSQVQLKQVYSNSDLQIGMIHTSSHIGDSHKRSVCRKYIKDNADYCINFHPEIGDSLEDTEWYTTRWSSDDIGKRTAALCSRIDQSSNLYHSFPMYPPIHSKKEVFSGSLLSQKI